MDHVWALVLTGAGIYLLYELATWYWGIHRPPPPYSDEDPVLGRVAIVTKAIASPGGKGEVELNGTVWVATLRDPAQTLGAGERCRVSDREGLSLVVEAA